jgi:hypothetical protein
MGDGVLPRLGSGEKGGLYFRGVNSDPIPWGAETERVGDDTVALRRPMAAYPRA